MLLSAMDESGKHASLPLALNAVLVCGTLQLISAFVITFTTLKSALLPLHLPGSGVKFSQARAASGSSMGTTSFAPQSLLLGLCVPLQSATLLWRVTGVMLLLSRHSRISSRTSSLI